jgi:hypothetical protein
MSPSFKNTITKKGLKVKAPSSNLCTEKRKSYEDTPVSFWKVARIHNWNAFNFMIQLYLIFHVM